ncbi:MAG: AAA family ATPase [Legionellales bacterium]|nr:MAG: AAA family ATPase [Legionellales bacterium]
MFHRLLKMHLPQGQSAFLWGTRQTGKSCFLKHNFKASRYYDLLDSHEISRFSKYPSLLKEEVLAMEKEDLRQPIIIDEIQKVPELLNEVHWLIENTDAQFILCGSSTRQLKKIGINLLGGRAWKYNFFPLVFPEIPNFDLLKALQHGLVPNHYLSNSTDIDNHLQAYVDVYLTEEIRNEGLVRNLSGFARFIDVAGLSSGEMININNIARDCGVDRTTVQGYYQILIDTSLGYFLYPYRKKIKRDIIMATPKFYLFDVGIANYLAKSTVTALQGSAAGKSFEHYILMELVAYLGLKRKRLDITYWRTKQGLEVDCILGNAKFAIEIKISSQVHRENLKGIIAFCEEHPQAQAIVVSQDKLPRKVQINQEQSITILPWKIFLEKLWRDEIICD